MLRYYFIFCAHNAIVVVRPLFARARARLSVSKNMDDYIPGEGAALRSFAAEVIVVVARRQILRTATLSGRRPLASPVDPRRGGPDCDVVRGLPGATTGQARPTTGPASVQTSVTPHHLNSALSTQNSFSFYRNPNVCP